MGNASSTREEELENGHDDPRMRSDGRDDIEGFLRPPSRDPRHGAARRVHSAESMGNGGATPPESPRRSRSPLMFTPQIPVAPLQRPTDAPPMFNQLWMNETYEPFDVPVEKGIPTLITWNLGGKDVLVEGSWDNWASRKALHRSGKDYSILLVLPSGVYQYKFIVDGEWRYIQDLPSIADEMGHISNILDVHIAPEEIKETSSTFIVDYVPENLESVLEFEPPPSPDSSYSQPLPLDEDFAKEPPAVPPQVHLTVLGGQESEEEATEKPQHVVLNHLFIEKAWTPQSLVALGLTHRFQSKYVTLVLYKPTGR